MCCLFGFIDYNHNLSGKQKNRLLRSLICSPLMKQ